MKKLLFLLLISLLICCGCKSKEASITMKQHSYSGYDFSSYWDKDEKSVLGALENLGFESEKINDQQYRIKEQIQGIEFTVEFSFWQSEEQKDPILVRYAKWYNKEDTGTENEREFKEKFMNERFEMKGEGIDNNTNMEVAVYSEIEDKGSIHISWWGDEYIYIADVSIRDNDEYFDIQFNEYGPSYEKMMDSLTSIGD